MKTIHELKDEFEKNYGLYATNESQTRQSLIDVMLVNLGWDVTDPKMVRVEPPVETRSGKKKADYILYDDRGQPVVVIEAKAPKVNIAKDTNAIFQVLRYGWNLETVSVGILTDFEEWEVYNTSTQPTRETSRFRIPDLCCTYREYEQKWDTLAGYFSRSAVLEGKLRAYATTTKVSLPPDEAFLKDLERYRKLIADALVKNESLHFDWDLSERTQRVLDRLLLLRILEDRGYGERGGWLHQIAAATDPGRHLSDLVARLQPTYNSRFFEPHPVDGLRLEPEKLRAVVKELADPDSVYDFSAMPVEIIGKAYEKFLGSQMRITPARRVKLEPKPEVRKAGGVYYTPRYIVDYIVENTLSPLFEGKSETQAAKLKVLDPACGSGSFLIGAARWLERWYSEKYGRPADYEERRTIVLRHLHGVDIDANAVEVTQLSLCLWLLENAPVQTALLHEALLPDLSGNVKCGNSLIGSDFYTAAGQQDLFADEQTRHRINAFDWDGPHGWPEIMKKKTERRIWFVTFVTHNSRVSERMVELGIPKKDPLIFGPNVQMLIAEKIADVCKNNEIPIVAWNVLRDHVHMLIGSRNEKELDELVRKIKGGSARAYREATGMGKGGHVWAQKFNRKEVRGEDDLNNIYNYIKENHLKHAVKDKGLQPLASPAAPDKGLQPLAEEGGKGLKPLVSDELLAFRRKLEPILNSVTVSVEEATSVRGGFDAVIGNPPYGAALNETEKKYLNVKYSLALYQIDTYLLFTEMGFNLLKTGGLLGNIIPAAWLSAYYYADYRKFLLNNTCLISITECPKHVFETAVVETVILIIGNIIQERKKRNFDIRVIDSDGFIKEGNTENGEEVLNDPEARIHISVKGGLKPLLTKLNHLPKLEKFALISWGVKCYQIGKGKPKQTKEEKDKNIFVASEQMSKQWKNLIKGKDVDRYHISEPHLYIKYGVWLAEPRDPFFFSGDRILIREVTTKGRIQAVITTDEYIHSNAVDCIKVNDPKHTKYYLGLVNSCLLSLYHRLISPNAGKATFPKVLLNDLRQLPIRTIDFSDKQDVARHDKMVELVERMLDLHKRLPEATGSDKAQLEQLIARTDKEIDALVYELYDLTSEEIKIVEEAVK